MVPVKLKAVSSKTMARQTNIKVRGRVENIIFYQSRGVDCMRIVPPVVRVAPASLKTAGIFGKASAASKTLRTLLRPVLPEPANREIMYRTNAAFRNWLQTEPLNHKAPVSQIDKLNGLSFILDYDLKYFLKTAININRDAAGHLHLQIPAFDPVKDIKAPAKTNSLFIRLSIASFQMNDLTAQDCTETGIEINYVPGGLNTQEIVLPGSAASGKLAMVVVTIQNYTAPGAQQPMNHLKWRPADVICSFYN